MYSISVCIQLLERIILNSEMADVNSNFNSAVKASLLELERVGMSRVLHNHQWESQSDFYTGRQDKICSQY